MAPSRKTPKKSPAAGKGAKAKKATPPAKKPAAKKPAAAKKAAPKKASSKKAAPAKPAKQKAATPAAPEQPEPAAPIAAAPKPTPPEPDPEFVRERTAADRKAALEALLEKEGVNAVFPTVQNPNVPRPPPQYVRERSAQERKAVVEQLAEESGVVTALQTAPWKRRPGGGDEPRKPTAPPTPAEPQRAAPRAHMTTTPLAQTETRSAPRVVILDSNALMMQFQFHVDIEREVRRILDINFDIVVPTVVLLELERLAKEGMQKEAGEARMALELAKTFRVEETPADGDTAILRLAEKLNAIVVTNDKRLRARLRAKAIPNIYMRSRAFLTLEGHIPGT